MVRSDELGSHTQELLPGVLQGVALEVVLNKLDDGDQTRPDQTRPDQTNTSHISIGGKDGEIQGKIGGTKGGISKQI